MRYVAVFVALLVPALGQSPSELIGTIDFYGYGTTPIESVRKVLPFHEGDKVPSDEVRMETERALGEMAGRRGRINLVCCLADGKSTVYVGLAEVGAPRVRYYPKPTGNVKLPDEVVQLSQQLDDHLNAAVERGTASEDDSQGYALVKDPAPHADQLKLRDWARRNVDLILRVLTESSDPEHRANAARALGYVDRSRRQIDGLVEAAFDSDGLVRNNAVRALETLCTLGKEVTSQIPAERFIPLLHSLTWTDRNKGSLLLAELTESRDPALLKLLHDRALEPLREMARWKDFGHAVPALEILGRIGGMKEERIEHLDASMVEEILHSVK